MMIKIRLRELILRKELRENKKIRLQDLGQECGISHSTLTRILSPDYGKTDLEIIDRLCQYFNCPIGDLLEFIPDKKAEDRELNLNDINKRKKLLDDQLPCLIADKLGFSKIDKEKIETNKKLFTQNNESINVDMVIKDDDNKKIFVKTRPRLHYEFDKKYIENALSLEPNKLIFLSYSEKIPQNIKAYFDKPEFEVYHAKIYYDDFKDKVKDISLKKIK